MKRLLLLLALFATTAHAQVYLPAAAPAWSAVTGKPTTVSGLGVTNGATIDSWGGKTVPAGTVVGTTDSQDLSAKHIVTSAIGLTSSLGINIGTATATGGDDKGKLNIHPTSTGPTGGAVVCHVAFGRAYNNAPAAIVLGSLDSTTMTSQASTKGVFAGNLATTGFDILSGAAGITQDLNLQFVVATQ